jgi:hypothetical protein
MRLLLAAAALLLVAAVSAPEGEMLYNSGGQMEFLEDGQAIKGKAAACVNCHQHPLDGATEGGVLAPALAWSRMTNRIGDTPSQAAFLRAVNDGIGFDGRPLHRLMPRYRLSDVDANALVAYLQRSDLLPGLTTQQVTLATTRPADPRLRPAADKAIAALETEIAAVNAAHAIHGRKLTIDILDLAHGDDAVIRQIEAKPPLLLIGPTGIAKGSMLWRYLEKRKIAQLAPLVALSGAESPDLVIPIRPSLGMQVRKLAAEAQRQHGCVTIHSGSDPISKEAASKALVEPVNDGCPAHLLIGNRNELLSFAQRIAERAVLQTNKPTLYVVAEQAGGVLENNGATQTRYSVITELSFANEALRNARLAFAALHKGLSDAGRNPGPRQLQAAIRRSIPTQDIAIVTTYGF